jgi:peptide/nickel transport system substrate-binding protein
MEDPMSINSTLRLTDRSVGKASRRRLGAAVTAGFAALAAIAMVSSPAAAGVRMDGSSPSPSVSPNAPASAAAGACGTAGVSTFVLGNTQDLDSRNPFSGQLSISADLYDDVYDYLTSDAQKDYAPAPDLATSWTHTPDGLTWTFTIRSDVKWSDGVPLTAADIAYTYTRAIKDPNANAVDYGDVKNMKTVVATNPTTVVFTMNHPDAVILQMTEPILPEHIWDKVPYSQTGTFSNAAMVGSGPFQLVSWQKGQSIVLKANKNYWGGAPKIDCLVYKLYDNEEAEILALKSGEIDGVDGISGADYKSLAGQSGITRIAGAAASFDELSFNTGAALTNGKPVGNGAPASRDPKFRQAVAYAIDTKTIIQRSLLGYGQQAASIVPSVFSLYTYDPGSARYTYDPTKAEQMLDAAGYTKGPDGMRIDPTTHKEMNLRLDAVNDSPSYTADLQYVAEYLKAVGIKTTTNSYSDDKLTDLIGNGQYDMFIWGWVPSVDPDFQLSTMTCDQRDTGTVSDPVAGWSDSFFCNSSYDQMYAQQAQQIDLTQRANTIKQMQALLYQQSPYIVLYYEDDLEAYNSAKWVNVQPQPTKGGGIFFQSGTYTYTHVELRSSLKTASASNSGGGGGGTSPVVWIVVGVVVLALIVGGGFLARRRRSTADERE